MTKKAKELKEKAFELASDCQLEWPLDDSSVNAAFESYYQELLREVLHYALKLKIKLRLLYRRGIDKEACAYIDSTSVYMVNNYYPLSEEAVKRMLEFLETINLDVLYAFDEFLDITEGYCVFEELYKKDFNMLMSAFGEYQSAIYFPYNPEELID